MKLSSRAFGLMGGIMMYLSGLAATATATADDSSLPEPFQGHADIRTFDIYYDDLSYILRTTVFDSGLSDRTLARPKRPTINTRITRGNKSLNRLEGNRLVFLAFEDENLEAIQAIRTGLEATPDQIPMREWTKNQQLAFWLNLYNVTLIEALAHHYPETNLRDLLYGEDSLLDEKLLTVAGVPLSLNNIHQDILIPKWQDPLVMYGLFHGYVGSPNIRREAYTPENVYAALKENAREFINSNRGVRADDGKLKVSVLYAQNAGLFPNWEQDVKTHITKYADRRTRRQMGQTSWVEASNEDFYIADLYEGIPHDLSISYPGAPMLESSPQMAHLKLTGTGREMTPPHVMEFVKTIKTKKSRQKATVTVDEVAEGTETESENK